MVSDTTRSAESSQSPADKFALSTNPKKTLVPFPQPPGSSALVRPRVRRVTVTRKGTHTARCIRQPLTLAESVAVAIRVENLLEAKQALLQAALDDILREAGAEAMEFFETYGTHNARSTPPDIAIQQADWWERLIAPRLENIGGGVGQTLPRTAYQQLPLTELHWQIGIFGRYGLQLTLRLFSGVGQQDWGYCERYTPYAATIAVDVFAWLREILAGGERLGRATLAEICHHEVAHLSAYDTPHSLREEAITANYEGRSYAAQALRSVEIFCAGRGRAALLHNLGYTDWTDEVPDGVGRRSPTGLNVLNCRHPLPNIAGWDVESRRRLFNRIGRRYFQELYRVHSTPWKKRWPDAAIGFAVLDDRDLDP